MATYVLVHGAGHGGWCYQRVARLLRAEGHEVYTPSLTGLGERAHLLTPHVGLDTHIADIVSLLEHEDLTDVILAGHSYGGIVITGAADRALNRVAQLVYLDAAILYNGESLHDVTPALAMMRWKPRGLSHSSPFCMASCCTRPASSTALAPRPEATTTRAAGPAFSNRSPSDCT